MNEAKQQDNLEILIAKWCAAVDDLKTRLVKEVKPCIGKSSFAFSSIPVATADDIKKARIITMTGFYVICTNYVGDAVIGNRCTYRSVGQNLRAVYRGHAYKVGARLFEHLFTRMPGDNPVRIKLFKGEDGKFIEGVNIDVDKELKDAKWEIDYIRLPKSSELVREAFELALDQLFEDTPILNKRDRQARRQE